MACNSFIHKHTAPLTPHLVFAVHIFVHLPAKVTIHVQCQRHKHSCEHKQHSHLRKEEHEKGGGEIIVMCVLS